MICLDVFLCISRCCTGFAAMFCLYLAVIVLIVLFVVDLCIVLWLCVLLIFG